MKNAINYLSRMNKLTCFNWKYSKKTRKLSKNDKFVTSKTKICLFYWFYLFYKINTKLSVDSFYFSGYPLRKSPE